MMTARVEKSEHLPEADEEEETDEINACSIIVPVEIDGKTEEWLMHS